MSRKNRDKPKPAQPPKSIPAAPKPAPKEVSEQKSENEISTNSNKPKPERAWYKPESPIAAASLVAGVVVAIIYFFQLVEMREQVALSRRAMEIDQRAWVGANIVGIVNAPIEANKPIIVGINYLNTGKTPALDVDAFMNPPELMVSSVALNFSKFNPPHGTGNFVLFPGASNHLQETVRGVPHGIPQELIEDIKNGATTISIYGIIRYHDIFSTKEHWTHFCLLYSAQKNGFVYCNTYNDTDDGHTK